MMSLENALFGVCSAKMLRARSNERPALIIVANCRENIATSRSLIRSVNPGIEISF